MTNIRYVCLSDIHLGQVDSILTKLKDDATKKRKPGESDIDWQHHSPVMASLCDCFRVLADNNTDQERKPILILAGDAIENALTETNDSMMVFERFIELILKRNEELFEEIIFVPGNHDHHMWEIARETQYVDNYIQDTTFGTKLEAQWHFTKMFKKDEQSWSDDYFMEKLIDRLPPANSFRVRVAYPNMGIHNQAKDRCVIFHHGHYTEDIYYLISEFASMVDPTHKLPELVGDIEAENFAWIDFFWSALGRSGHAGPLIGNIYVTLSVPKARNKMLDNIAKNLADRICPIKIVSCIIQLFLKVGLRWLATRISDRERSVNKDYPLRGVLLSSKGLKTFRKYLQGPLFRQMKYEIGKRWNTDRTPSDVTFVFGHTHKPFESNVRLKGFTNEVRVFNTGGWVVENTTPESEYGAAAVLVDDDLNVTSLRLYNEVESDNECEVRVSDTDPQPNPLTQYVRELIQKDASPWKKFSQKVAQQLSIHRQYLKHRISELEK